MLELLNAYTKEKIYQYNLSPVYILEDVGKKKYRNCAKENNYGMRRTETEKIFSKVKRKFGGN